MKLEATLKKQLFKGSIVFSCNFFGQTPTGKQCQNKKIEIKVGKIHSSLLRVQHTFQIFVLGSIGTVISGYRVRNGVWTLIGKGDPQRPQVNNNVNLIAFLVPQ